MGFLWSTWINLKIKIWHGSNVLEDKDNYKLLAKMLYDIQVPSDGVYGKQNILAGTRNDLMTSIAVPAIAGVAAIPTIVAGAANVATPAVAAIAAVPASTSLLPVLQVNSGELIGASVAAATSTTSRTYC